MDSWPHKHGKPVLNNTHDALAYAHYIKNDPERVFYLDVYIEAGERHLADLLTAKSFNAQRAMNQATYVQLLREAKDEIDRIEQQRKERQLFKDHLGTLTTVLGLC